MNDQESATDWLAQYHEREQQELEAGRGTLASLCPSLAELNVIQVRIAYDGYGDSGAVESVTATGEAGEIELPQELSDALVAATELILPGGWEIDAGAYGELVLDVPMRRVTREHHWRMETSEYDEEGWQL